MSIVVIQHSDFGHAGRFGVTLRDNGFRLDTRRVDLPREAGGRPVPTDLDGVGGVLVLGGHQNVGDPFPWMAEEIAFIREAHRRELPVLGICLGAQLIAAALGGQVGAMEKPELGFHSVSLNPAGQTETMLAGIAWDSPQFCMHEQEVTQLPPGATLLAGSAACKVQAFKAGLRTFAVQYHPECDREMIERFCAESEALLTRSGLSRAAVAAQAERFYPAYARLADRLAVNFATYSFPVPSRLGA